MPVITTRPVRLSGSDCAWTTSGRSNGMANQWPIETLSGSELPSLQTLAGEPTTNHFQIPARRRAAKFLRLRRQRPRPRHITFGDRLAGTLAQPPGSRHESHDRPQIAAAARALCPPTQARL